MNPNQVASQITQWLKIAIVLMVLLSIAAVLLRSLGVQLPIRTIGHIELAYLAGAYWLVK